MGLQKFKLHLANSVFTEENSSLKSMDTTQLLDLMNYSGSSPAEKPAQQGDMEGLDGSVPSKVSAALSVTYRSKHDAVPCCAGWRQEGAQVGPVESRGASLRAATQTDV